MGILSGPEIVKQFRAGRIHISPFEEKHVGPNSYDLRLSPDLMVYSEIVNGGALMPGLILGNLDVSKPNGVKTLTIPAEGMVLKPNTLYLGSTIEEAGSDFYVPAIEGRSSMARLGISPHVSAGFGDHGFKRRWTLEITVAHPIRVYPGIRICQVVFHELIGERQPYQGKYVASNGTEASRSHEDFHEQASPQP